MPLRASANNPSELRAGTPLTTIDENKMSEAAIQLDLLEENIDLKAIPFDESALILSKFLQQYATEMCEKRQFSGDFLRWTTETLALRLTPGKIPAVAELRQTRANTWELYHAEPDSPKKHFLRAVICCLYDKDTDETTELETPEMVELFFFVLLDVGPGVCERFRVFFESQDKQH